MSSSLVTSPVNLFITSTHCKKWIVAVDEQRRRRRQSCLAFLSSPYAVKSDDNDNDEQYHKKKLLPVFNSPQSSLYAPESTITESTDSSYSQHKELIDVEVEQGEVFMSFFSTLIRSCGPGPDCKIKTTWRVPVSM